MDLAHVAAGDFSSRLMIESASNVREASGKESDEQLSDFALKEHAGLYFTARMDAKLKH